MPRFFFDFRQGDTRSPDAAGMEFDSVEDAYREAQRGAQDMWSELLREKHDPRRCFFEVRDAQRILLFVFPFVEAMNDCQESPPPGLVNAQSAVDNIRHAQRIRREFMEELSAIRKTIGESQELLKVKI